MAKKTKKTKGSFFAKVKKTAEPTTEETTEEVVAEEVVKPKVKKAPAKKKNIVKLKGKEIDVDSLTPADIRKLAGEWGRGRLKNLGII